MSDRIFSEYAVTAVKMIEQARREGYNPLLLADVIEAICLPSDSQHNWGIPGKIRTLAMTYCEQYARSAMAGGRGYKHPFEPTPCPECGALVHHYMSFVFNTDSYGNRLDTNHQCSGKAGIPSEPSTQCP